MRLKDGNIICEETCARSIAVRKENDDRSVSGIVPVFTRKNLWRSEIIISVLLKYTVM